jgi:hypothetical protein
MEHKGRDILKSSFKIYFTKHTFILLCVLRISRWGGHLVCDYWDGMNFWFEIPTAVVMKSSSIFCYTTPCSPLEINDVSETYFASIFKQSREEYKRSIKQSSTTLFTLISSLVYSSTLMMVVACFSETPVDFQQATRLYIPEDRYLHGTTDFQIMSRCWINSREIGRLPWIVEGDSTGLCQSIVSEI